jgi:hypothetical protein
MCFYNKLGLKPYINNTLEENFKKKLQINEIVHNNVMKELFSIYTHSKTFNNNRQITKLLKKQKNINDNCSIYNGTIKFKNKNIYTKIFIKKVYFFNPLILSVVSDKFYDKLSLYSNLFNKCNSANIELFVYYLCSKLVEMKISPHFPYFYGFSQCEENIYRKQLNYVEQRRLNYPTNKFINYNIPCMFLFLENLTGELFSYLNNNKYSINELTSYIFQLLASLSIIQHYFNLSHNDLHSKNIMFLKTNKTFIYYKYNNLYFKIKSYNKVIKIVDWGRATYNFNLLEGKNDCFETNGDVFGQIIYKKVNIQGKKNILYSKFNDLGILGGNLLNINNFPKSGKLYRLIKSWTLNKENKYINHKINSFDFYTKCSECSKTPSKQLDSKIFEKFHIQKKNIPNNEVIFNLY